MEDIHRFVAKRSRDEVSFDQSIQSVPVAGARFMSMKYRLVVYIVVSQHLSGILVQRSLIVRS